MTLLQSKLKVADAVLLKAKNKGQTPCSSFRDSGECPGHCRWFENKCQDHTPSSATCSDFKDSGECPEHCQWANNKCQAHKSDRLNKEFMDAFFGPTPKAEASSTHHDADGSKAAKEHHDSDGSKAAKDLMDGLFGLFAPDKHQEQAISFKAAMAEYLAMTLFVAIGCGAAMTVANEPGWVLQVAFAFGLAITALVYTVGHFSGGQINCAVTLGLVLAGKVTVAQGLLNFVAQMLGSITGAFILTLMIPEEVDKTGALGTNKIADKLSKVNAFVGEFLFTFLLMFVVLETAVNPDTKANREMAALAIGFAVFLAHAVLINVDGCSINPTRTFGPAVVRQLMYKNKAVSHDEQVVFWAGPLLGAAGAVLVSTLMR